MTDCIIENAVSPGLLAQFMAVLDEKPELFPHLEMVWQGFHFLSAHRPMGFGMEAIPPPWLYDWCERHGLDGEEQEVTVSLLSDLDNHYRELIAEKEKAKEKK